MSAGLSSCNLQASGPRDAASLSRRRSTRLTISIPLVVRGKDASDAPFEEPAKTLVVNLHGAMIALSRQLKVDSEVVLENPTLRKTAAAVVLWCKQRKSELSCYEAAVELRQPQDLWGICFPSKERESAATATNPPANLEAPAEASRAAIPAAASAGVKHGSSVEELGATVEALGIPPSTIPGPVAGQEAPAARPTDAACEEERTRFQASLKELSAACVEDVRLLAEAHVRLFNETLAKRALVSRETCVKELEQPLTELSQAALEELRKQMEQELEAFLKRASAQADQLAKSVLKAMESRIGSIQLQVVAVKAADH